MILLTVKPFLTTFQIGMISFIFIAFMWWVFANVTYRIRANRQRDEVKRKRHMKVVEPFDSPLSSAHSQTFKN